MSSGSLGSQGQNRGLGRLRGLSGDPTPRADHPTLSGFAAAEGNHMFYGQGAVPIFYKVY